MKNAENQLTYKGYVGEFEIDWESGVIVGGTVGMRGGVTIEARSIEEARRAFEEGVDAYLKSCAEDGVEPEAPPVGRRLAPADAS